MSIMRIELHIICRRKMIVTFMLYLIRNSLSDVKISNYMIKLCMNNVHMH